MSASKLTSALIALSASCALSVRVTVKSHDAGAAADIGECEDKDKYTNFATNSLGWDCSMYSKSLCISKYDTESFKAADMCCVCGGGYYASAVNTNVACSATCHGYTCDDWINNGGGNTCQDLETNFGCDCSGCICGAGYVNESYQEYPQDSNQYPQESYDYYTDGNYAYYDEPAAEEDDGKPQYIDPRNNYWAMGEGYCADEHGENVGYQRIPGMIPILCADRCNKNGDCHGYANDDMGCLLYFSPVAQANGDESGYGCFIKATYEEQQPVGPDTQEGAAEPGAEKTEEVFLDPVEHSKGCVDSQEPKEEQTQDAVDNTVALDDGETTELSTSQKFNHPPLGAVDASLAQVFLWLERKQTFVLKQRFEPPSYCVDGHEQCHQWASEGWCTMGTPENTQWMTENCRFSCSVCAPVIQAPPNHVVAKFRRRVFTVHGTVEVNLLGRDYYLQKPNALINLATTWRVTLTNDKILFSVQKAPCVKTDKECLAVWKIFQGRTHENKVVYYGIQRTSTFKFYKSEADFQQNPKHSWRAELRQLVPSKQEPASYKVTVMPNDDAGLILLAAYIVNKHEDLIQDKGTSDTESNGYGSGREQ